MPTATRQTMLDAAILLVYAGLITNAEYSRIHEEIYGDDDEDPRWSADGEDC